MKKTVYIILGTILFLYSCSSNKPSEINNLNNSNFESENIRIINEIINDTKEQIPYIDNSFYVFHDDYLKNIDISKNEIEFIINQNKILDTVDFTFKDGEIQYFDTITNERSKAKIIKSKEDSYNKEVLQISRPYKLNEDKVIIFFYGTTLFYKDNHEGPVVGGIWAIKYKKSEGKWILEKYYSIADLT